MRSVFHFRGLVTGRHANTKKQKPSSHNGATKTQTVPKVREMRTCSGGGAGAGVAGVLREKKNKKKNRQAGRHHQQLRAKRPENCDA